MLKHSLLETDNSNISLFQNNRNWNQIKDDWLELVNHIHNSGMAQGGIACSKFEGTLASYFQRKYCIATASCTDALTLSLIALNLPKGSYVATSNYTFTATAHAISRAGYIPVAIDVDKNYCIDVTKIRNVSAVVAVDLFGNMCDWDALNSLGIPIIADSAQSFESADSKGYSGSKGLASCLSFSPSKTMSSWGSGGAILTDDPVMAETCQKLRLHGKTKNNDLAIGAGLNSMMSSAEIAAVTIAMQHASEWLTRRKKIAEYIVSQAKCECANDFSLTHNSLHKLVFKDSNRAYWMKKLADANIASAIHYETLINDEPLYHMPVHVENSELLRDISFTVPNQHTLTDSEVERIAKVLT
jgi:UDP-2-acetamido-2-deoxy-ribo-hexuluronate aminotransferase